MPKLTKESNKKVEKVNINTNIIEDEHDEIDDNQDDNQDDDDQDDDQDDNQDNDSNEDVTEDKKKQTKFTSHELYTEISQRFSTLVKADEDFIKKEKEFEREQKEFNSSRKKIMREIDNYMKRFEKAFTSEVGKKKKPRNTENAGKGGFNKQTEVPEILRKYIGIDEDDKKSRPEVTKLLNEKFKEAGLMKTETDDNAKDIKYIVFDKVNAKKLGKTAGDKIRNKDIQTFIAQFYHAAQTINT